MRALILTIFVVAAVAFVLTDPRWSDQLASPISASWQVTAAPHDGIEGVRAASLGPEQRCAFAGRWLMERQQQSEVIQKAELAAVEQIMAGCQRQL